MIIAFLAAGEVCRGGFTGFGLLNLMTLLMQKFRVAGRSETISIMLTSAMANHAGHTIPLGTILDHL